MHFKKNAVHPLERFPLEIWQLIANNLDPFELEKLKLSSMTLYTSLQKRKDKKLNAVGQLAVRWYSKLDWSRKSVLCVASHTHVSIHSPVPMADTSPVRSAEISYAKVAFDWPPT